MLEAEQGLVSPSGDVSVAAQRWMVSVAAFAGAAAALEAALGALPGAGRCLVRDGARYVWAGPERWLVVADDDALEERILTAAGGLAAVTDQSDGKIVFLVGGARVRDRLQKLVPVDLDVCAFGEDATALTLAGHVPVQIWREGEYFAVACFRSFAESLLDGLVGAFG